MVAGQERLLLHSIAHLPLFRLA
jgi:hypothetical protein